MDVQNTAQLRAAENSHTGIDEELTLLDESYVIKVEILNTDVGLKLREDNDESHSRLEMLSSPDTADENGLSFADQVQILDVQVKDLEKRNLQLVKENERLNNLYKKQAAKLKKLQEEARQTREHQFTDFFSARGLRTIVPKPATPTMQNQLIMSQPAAIFNINPFSGECEPQMDKFQENMAPNDLSCMPTVKVAIPRSKPAYVKPKKIRKRAAVQRELLSLSTEDTDSKKPNILRRSQ